MNKKIILTLSIGVLFFSCKEDTLEDSISVGKATISGVIEVNKDVTNDTNDFGNAKEQLESLSIPSGTKIQFFIDGKDLQLDPVNGYVYEDVMIEAELNEDGSYMVELPVRKNSTNVKVTFPEIKDVFTFSEYDPKLEKYVNKTENAVFYLSNKLISISPNSVLFHDYKYLKK